MRSALRCHWTSESQQLLTPCFRSMAKTAGVIQEEEPCFQPHLSALSSASSPSCNLHPEFHQRFRRKSPKCPLLSILGQQFFICGTQCSFEKFIPMSSFPTSPSKDKQFCVC